MSSLGALAQQLKEMRLTQLLHRHLLVTQRIHLARLLRGLHRPCLIDIVFCRSLRGANRIEQLDN